MDSRLVRTLLVPVGALVVMTAFNLVHFQNALRQVGALQGLLEMVAYSLPAILLYGAVATAVCFLVSGFNVERFKDRMFWALIIAYGVMLPMYMLGMNAEG